MALKLVSSQRAFEGTLKKYEHESTECKCTMRFNVYLPPSVDVTTKFPCVWFLSGLTCNEDNFIQKAGALRSAAKHRLALIAPDTSPRGVEVEGQDESWDFGSGAGFYVDATQEPWSQHYRMDSYITRELPSLLIAHFPIDGDRMGVMGHSMGGHGALTVFLKHADRYVSCSAFAPICHPSACKWGQKAFQGYLGITNQDEWKHYDATSLVAAYRGRPIQLLIDQGGDDAFLVGEHNQLQPNALLDAVKKRGDDQLVRVEYRLRAGYDHSYYYISTFIDEHLDWHASQLKH